MSTRPYPVLDRRRFVTRLVPACSLACLSAGSLAALAGAASDPPAGEGLHKFDVPADLQMTPRQRVIEQDANLIRFIKTLQTEMEEGELIRLLKVYSARLGREVGARQAQSSPDTSFATFTNTFRPPKYEDLLTLEIVEDTEKVFQLNVTECLLATVYRSAGLGGEIGHAAVCNMDYSWPPAFNPAFKMERTKTLMQGDAFCNHRYIDTTA